MHSRLLYLRAPLALLVLACALSACGGGDGGGGGGGGGFSASATAKDSGDNSAKTDPAPTTPDAGNNSEPNVSYAP
jgi:hypothetical protein